MVFVTSTIVQIGLEPLDRGDIPSGGSVYVDPAHITRIEPLNGKRRPNRKSRRT